MEKIFDLTGADARLFLLVLFRISGVLLVAPVFGSATIPHPAKISFALVLAVLFFPMVGRTGLSVEPAPAAYLLAAGGELVVGLLIGFAASLLFSAVQLGGQLIDQELGIMMANVIDPVSNEQVSVVAQFKLMLSVVVYLLIDGHHFLLTAVRDSFAAVPLLGVRVSGAAAARLSDALMGDLFRMAVQIAAPAMVTLFLITVAMAFMARAVPEMNVFILGFPVRIAVGLAVLAVGVGLFVHGFRAMHAANAGAVRALLGGLGG
jgi:flagellar biosynthetic protein FliR